ncbi:MAG: hypothetical protein ACLSA2_03580 [Candidatus Gastranaerophilaceae bacterium]
MENIKITAPVKKPEDIEVFAKKPLAEIITFIIKNFLNNNFDYINEFVHTAKITTALFILTSNTTLQKKIFRK